MQAPIEIDLSKKPLLKLYNEVKYFFQRTFQRRKLLKRVAIHESGHIVFAYFYGFTVSKSVLLSDSPGNGYTEIVYGGSAIAANIIFNNWIVDYQRQSQQAKNQIIRIGVHLMVIHFAGSAAEAYVKCKNKDQEYDLEISGEDLNVVQQIDRFLVMVSRPSAIQDSARMVFDFFENYPILGKAVRVLAEKFQSSPSKSLTKIEIEDALYSVNFFNEMATIINAGPN